MIFSGNASVKSMITQTSETRKNLNQIATDSGESLKGVNTQFQQSLLPQVNQTLDSFAALSGNTVIYTDARRLIVYEIIPSRALAVIKFAQVFIAVSN